MTTSKQLLQRSRVPWKPRLHQKHGVKFLLEHACGALFFDPGLGKTSTTLGALKMLFAAKKIKKVLLIAPLRPCYLVWPPEMEKWKDFEGMTVSILHGPKKDQALKENTQIHVINPEGLDWLLGVEKFKSEKTGKKSVKVDVKKFKQLGYDVLVIDELSKFKNTGSLRFKAIKQVLHTFGRRWGLTGTPMSNGLMDLFGQVYILDEGAAFTPFITQFRMNYFIQVEPFTWVPIQGADKLIYQKLKPLVLRRDARECLDLPLLVDNDIYVDLPESAMKIYRELEYDLITKIAENEVTASSSAVASMKCRQVACGGLYLDAQLDDNGLKIHKRKRDWAALHDAKIEALKDLIEELQGEPILVAYDFAHDVERLRAAFPHATFACDYNMKQFTEIERAWNNNEIDQLFGHPVSLGHGLNLQGGNGRHVCWHSLTWDFEIYDQFIRRIWRQGNKTDRVMVHHIIARKTLDERIIRALKRKEKGQQALFEELKDLVKSRKK